jgi:chemotaxis protein MotB
LSVLHDGQRRTVGAVAQFLEDSAELTAEGKAQLADLAKALLGKRNKIEVRAHATRRPLPSGSPFQDAWHLCYARSLAVMKYLESQGIEADRIRLSQAGPFEPLTIREQPELQAQNARVEVYGLGELVEELVGTREERAKQFRSP